MSRGWEGRKVAWECWIHFYTVGGVEPVAYVHQCGSVTPLPGRGELAEACCSGCRFEMARPERECTPLYDRVSPAVLTIPAPDLIPIQGLADPEPTYLEGRVPRIGCRRCGQTWDPALEVHECQAVRGGG